MNDIKLGKYVHFKGSEYCVIGLAKHSETGEELVIYTDNNQTWARPKKMFLETVEKDGKEIPRFKFVGDK